MAHRRHKSCWRSSIQRPLLNLSAFSTRFLLKNLILYFLFFSLFSLGAGHLYNLASVLWIFNLMKEEEEEEDDEK